MFSRRVQVVERYWQNVYGKGPAAQTFIMFSILLLGFVYLLGSFYMIPASLVYAFKPEGKSP